MRLVVPRGGDRLKLIFVLGGVVRAEQEFATRHFHADVGLRPAAITPIKCGESWQICCCCRELFHVRASRSVLASYVLFIQPSLCDIYVSMT